MNIHRSKPARRLFTLTAALSLALISLPATAMFMRPNDAPVARLLRNAQAYVLEHPDDASGHYVLGRIHYLAWSTKAGFVPAYQTGTDDGSEAPAIPPNELLYFSPDQARQSEAIRRALETVGAEDMAGVTDHDVFWETVQAFQLKLTDQDWAPDELRVSQLDAHAEQAFAAFTQAITRAPDDGLYWLSRASLTQQYADRGAERGLSPTSLLPVTDDPELLSAAWKMYALDLYTHAFDRAAEADATREHQPVRGLQSLVSYEAAGACLELLPALGLTDDPRLTTMADHRKTIEALPMGPITPIVFNLNSNRDVNHWIDSNARVPFDLDGTGRTQAWTWPTADTHLLCWDPKQSGTITSGRQLFGSVTWWLMPENGYRALDLLDDDRDGSLTGAELDGLSGWRDANQNGVSEPGEVQTVQSLGITRIASRVTSQTSEGWPMNLRGVDTVDGCSLPSVDWIAENR